MSDAVDQADGAAPTTETIVNFRETLHVAYDKILVKRSEPVLMSKGGVHLSSAHTEPPAEGYVIITGEGRLMRDGTIVPLKVRKGNRVLFGKFSGSATEIDTPGGLLTVLREDEILAWWTSEEMPAEVGVASPTEGS